MKRLRLFVTIALLELLAIQPLLAMGQNISVGKHRYIAPSGSSPTLVHFYSGYSTMAGTAQTLGFTTTAGDFLVIGFENHNGGTVTGATASGHALTAAGNTTCGGSGCIYLYYLSNAAAVSQFQLTCTSCSYGTAFFLAEFSGISPTAAVSGTCGAAVAASASIGTWTSGVSHTAVAGELVVSANEMYYQAAQTITSQTATAPWSIAASYNDVGANTGGLIEYQANVSAGTYTGGGTASPTETGYLGTVTCGFK